MRRFYVVTFDRRPLLNYRGFHEAFVSHPKVELWWHWIKSMYIVGTSLSAQQLSDHYIATAKAHRIPTTHLVMAVDMERRQGMLPREAWSWIQKNA